MSKSRLDGTSDYARLKAELEMYKSRYIGLEDIVFNLKKAYKKAERLEQAENTLNRVLDLINSNEDLAYFHSTKKEIRKPIEDYFKGVRKNETKR